MSPLLYTDSGRGERSLHNTAYTIEVRSEYENSTPRRWIRLLLQLLLLVTYFSLAALCLLRFFGSRLCQTISCQLLHLPIFGTGSNLLDAARALECASQHQSGINDIEAWVADINMNQEVHHILNPNLHRRSASITCRCDWINSCRTFDRGRKGFPDSANVDLDYQKLLKGLNLHRMRMLPRLFSTSLIHPFTHVLLTVSTDSFLV